MEKETLNDTGSTCALEKCAENLSHGTASAIPINGSSIGEGEAHLLALFRSSTEPGGMIRRLDSPEYTGLTDKLKKVQKRLRDELAVDLQYLLDTQMNILADRTVLENEAAFLLGCRMCYKIMSAVQQPIGSPTEE